MSNIPEIINQFPAMSDEAISRTNPTPAAQSPNTLLTDTPELPVSMLAAMADVYKEAGTRAAKKEDNTRQDPAITQIPSRSEQEAQGDKEQGKFTTLERRWKRLANVLGSLGLRPNLA